MGGDKATETKFHVAYPVIDMTSTFNSVHRPTKQKSQRKLKAKIPKARNSLYPQLQKLPKSVDVARMGKFLFRTEVNQRT